MATGIISSNPLSLGYRIPKSMTFDPGTPPQPIADIAVGGTKLERATELFNRYPSASRQFILQLFQKHCDMTRAGAATYYTTIRSTQWNNTKAEWTKTKAEWKAQQESWAKRQLEIDF